MFNEKKAEMVTDEATQGRSKQSRQRLVGLEGMGRSSGRSRPQTKQEVKRTDFMIGMTCNNPSALSCRLWCGSDNTYLP